MTDPAADDQALNVQWPFKLLWNVLRGESVVADDDVILEELRVSYERIIRGLTLFPRYEEKEKPQSAEASAPATVTATILKEGASGTATTDDSLGATKQPQKEVNNTKENEKKLRKRIAEQLELDEDVAWDIFVSYMMFEYKGGSTSFEKLLETPRVSSDFIADLKHFYKNERIAILLVIQAIFGYASQPEHKYNKIFQAVCDWLKQEGIVALTENLLKSLDMATSTQEEIHVLHALTLFIYHMPIPGIEEFCKKFTSFRPGRKDKRALQAEAALLYTVMNFPLLQEAEEEVPESIKKATETFLENNADEFMLNDFNLGSMLSGYFSTCFNNKKVKEILGSTKHPFYKTFSSMLELANAYSSTNVENNRNNLCNVVLKAVLFSLRAITQGFSTEERIFRLGNRCDFYELAAVLMDHSEVAALLCCDEGSVLQMTVSTAMGDFPLKLKHMTRIWGSLCAANAQFPNQCIPLLKDCCKMVTTLAECVKNPDTIKEILELHANGYKLLESRKVAGIQLPPGTELDKIGEDSEKNWFTLYWRIPNNCVVDVFSVITKELLYPIATSLQTVVLGNTPVNEIVKWVQQEDENVWSVLKFLIKYASYAPTITEPLRQQFEPMAFIVFKTLDFVNQWKLRSELCSHLIELLVAANKFGVESWSHVYFSEVWPTPSGSSSFISEIIMGHESVSNTECQVTISFLKSILSFFKGSGGAVTFAHDLEETIAYNSVYFVNENVFHSFTRWRFSSQEAKYKILLNCLKVYNCVFDVKSPAWSKLKGECAKSLLAANSSLMTVLCSSEDGVQSSVIQPTRENCLIPEIIYQSLAALLKLFQLQQNSIRLVDATLGSTLVQKLGRFARHRMDYKIPTLAMALLKKIAEEINMSLLSCFGSEEVAFRDLTLQRLEFKSEDVNLKVAILDFLTVAAHTQPGLIQYIFMDDYLAQKIVDLPTEKDEGLALAVLCFLRALFRKGAIVMKKCSNLWENVFHPIKQIQQGGRLKIITCTLNIASFELYRYGMANSKFAAEVKSLLKEENFITFFQLPLSQRGDLSTKCLQSFKHFISVILHRNDTEACLNESTRESLLNLVSTRYWVDKELEKSEPHSSKVMMDLMFQLVNCISDLNFIGEFLNDISLRIGQHFFEDAVSVQIGCLALMNSCIGKAPEKFLTGEILENIVRIISKIFENASKIFKHVEESVNEIGPLISLSASIVISILKEVNVKEWRNLFHRYMIPHALVHATYEGISKCRKEDILLELLYVMLKMAEVKECAEALVSGLIVPKVFMIVMGNSGERATKEISEGTKWTKMYLVSLQLMTQILRTEKIFFVDTCLNVWSSHGLHIVEQLNSLPAMTNECKLNQPDYNFKQMKNLLTFNVYALDAVHAMIPFWKHWTLNNHFEHLRVLDAIFTAMQTSVNLLDQPQYLQSFITINKPLGPGTSYGETRTSPQLLELHSKLWDIIHLSTFIYWLLRDWTNDVMESGKMLGTSNQIAQACIKALSRPERKSHSSGGGVQSQSQGHHRVSISTISMVDSGRVTDTLERAMTLYLFHGKKALESDELPQKLKQTLTREVVSDAGTLCDGIRRIIISHPSELLGKLCYALEISFNCATTKERKPPGPYAALSLSDLPPEFNVDVINAQIRSSHRNHPVYQLGVDTPAHENRLKRTFTPDDD